MSTPPTSPKAPPPVRPGWQYSEVAVLPAEDSSWVYVLDNRRIPSSTTPSQVMADQLQEAAVRLGRRFLALVDGSYGSQVFRNATEGIACDVLARLAKNRVLYRRAPPVVGKAGPGHPTWHGAAFKLQDPTTHGRPDQQWEGTDAHGQRLGVRVWHQLHFQKEHTQEGSLYQVMRHGAKDTKRDPKASWFLFWGDRKSNV